MQAQELRIGNWVEDPLGEPMQVAQLGHPDKPDYIFAKGARGFGQNEFQPILLTPEILEKCGFEKHRSNEYTLDLGGPDKWLSISFYKDGIFPVLYTAPETQSDFGGYFACNKIESLHELQNIIHALTGDELEVSF